MATKRLEYIDTDVTGAIMDPVRKHRYSVPRRKDEADAGGPHYRYSVESLDGKDTFATIKFQEAGVQEVGVNGCFNEDLLTIVRDRLLSFQQGDFSCREYALALTKIEEALHWLHHRTEQQRKRETK